MLPLASADVLLAVAIASVAGGWLVWRAARFLRGGGARGASCCGGGRACSPSERDAAEVREAAARAASGMNRGAGRGAP